MDAPYEACVLTIGKFEGIHLGHRALLREVVNRAKSAGLASVAVAFEPHPFKFLRDPEYKPIFTKTERTELLQELGIDYIVTFDFDADFAAMSAVDFCRKIFIGSKPREIIVGENYRFGNKREGTIETLREAAIAHSAKIHVINNVATETTISTSRIREFLSAGELKKAEELLGFSFFVSGEVTKGRQLGRVLGFPTLNLYTGGDKFLPENGVYETRTSIDGVSMAGLTNIGLRPTVSNPGETQISVETHIPTLSAKPNEMYGRYIKVEFERFIRPERRFESAEELIEQIRKDILQMEAKI